MSNLSMRGTMKESWINSKTLPSPYITLENSLYITLKNSHYVNPFLLFTDAANPFLDEPNIPPTLHSNMHRVKGSYTSLSVQLLKTPSVRSGRGQDPLHVGAKGGGGKTKNISIKKIGVKVLLTNRIIWKWGGGGE